MAKQTLVRLGFPAGAKPTYDPISIPENALSEVRNVTPDEVGVLKLRPGSSALIASLGNGQIQALKSAFDTLITVWNKALYKKNGSSWSAIVLNTVGATTSTPISTTRWTYSGSEVVYLLGGNGLYRSDGSTCTLVTPYAPGAGEANNLLRDGSGNQDTTSGIYKSNIAILRPGLALRMAVAYGNSIYLSAPNDPSYYPADQVIQLPDDGDEITALDVRYNALIIFRNRDIWAFFGASVTAADAELVLQDGSVGCVAGRSVAFMPDVGLVFLGSDNVYALQGVSGIADQVKAVPIGDDMRSYIDRARKFGHANVCGVYHDRQYHLSFPDAVEPERVFRFVTYPEPGWYADTGPKTAAFAVHDDKLYCGDVSTGTVWERTGTKDDGQGIPVFVTFKHEMLSMGPARITRLFVFLAGQDTAQTISAAVVADGRTMDVLEMNFVGQANEQYSIGESAIGVASLGRFNRVFIYEGRLSSMRGQFAQVRIKATNPGEELGIIGYALEFRPKKRGKGIKTGVTVS